MDAVPEELKTLLEREKIRACIALVARGEDRRDADLLKAGYWPDSTVDFGVFQGDFDEYLAWVVPGSSAVPVTQHFLGQSVINSQGTAALMETHVMSYHRIVMGDEERDVTIGGRYLDRMEERGGDWRIAKRTMLYDWFQDFGRSADWSNGLMGAPFSAGHYAGRAVGDYSATFFGK
ncbi:nuclear transport factor 2 family protein [Streptomyces lutosisoli]|uniref:Nuclear transport factor 2 family protein n=1 Tax=Streptomyces lutosisoli TaxID=2665721 RepID=A0ABW2VZK5_9ACTN